MRIDSLTFLFFLLVSFLLFHLARRYAWRVGVLLGASAAFLSSFVAQAGLVVPLLAFGFSVIVGAYLIARRPTQALLWTFLVLLLSAFLVLKGYTDLEAVRNHPWVTIGISYMLFRGIQILADVSDGSLRKDDLNPVDMLLYLFSFLTLAAGPIQRYDEFRKQLPAIGDVRPGDIDWPAVLSRFALGYLKVTVLATLMLGIHNECVPARGPLSLAVAAFTFLAYVYLNFSGYMDVVISAGRLFGFRLPENFDSPYRASGFLDLWNRWHITLSVTFKTYVFFPLLRILMGIPGMRRHPAFAGAAGYFVVFFLMGLWHGNTSPFIVFGLLLGTGAAVNKFWEQFRTASGSRETRKPGDTWGDVLGRSASSSLALTWFAFSAITAWPSVTDMSSLSWVRSDFSSVIAGFAALFAAIALVKLAAVVFASRSGVIGDCLLATVNSRWIAPVATGLAIVIIVALKTSPGEAFSTIIFYQRF